MAFQLPISQPKYIAIDILRITQIPKRSTGSMPPDKTGPQTDAHEGIQVQNVANTREASPISSTETMGSPLVLPNTLASELPSNCSSPSNKPVIQTSSYVTFPEYQRTAKPERHVIKICAKKISIYFLNVGNRILGGLEAVGHFYASSEHKWQCEYAPLEPSPSQLTAWEAIDAADEAAKVERTRKRLRKSPRIKNLRPYGQSVAAQSAVTMSTSVPSTNDDEELSRKAHATSIIPSVSEQLLSKTKNRPQYMQPSHTPCQPLIPPTDHRQQPTTKPHGPSRIPLLRQRCFSPPHGRMYPLERQPKSRSSVPLSHGQRADSPTNSSYMSPQHHDRYGRHDRREQDEEVLNEEQQLKYVNYKEEKQELNEPIATPWSGLETVAEEQPFFGTAEEIAGEEAERDWNTSRSRINMENDIVETVTQSREEGERAIDCDGFEAGGEFCLRHESCAREAIALGYACLPA